MNCSAFQEHVHRFLDGDAVAIPDAFEEHRRVCGECRATYAAAIELARGLRLAPWPAAPAELSDRMVALILQERTHQARHARRTWAAAALAASVLIAATAITWLSRGEPGASATGGTANAGGYSGKPSLSLALDGSVADAGSTLTSLVAVTARETVKQGRLLLPDAVPSPTLANIDSLQQTLQPSARSLREAGQTLTASLEPVTASARRAVTTLQELSPISGDDK